MTDSDMCLRIKAQGKYSEGWWFFSSKTPAISTGFCSTSKEAEKEYEKRLKDFLLKNWNIAPDCVFLFEHKMKCNDAYFLDPEDDHSVKVSPEDIRISLTFCIQEQQNHTLDEFFRIKDDLIQCKSLEHAGKIVEIMNRIVEIADLTGVTPETVFNHAITEMKKQKEVVSV